MVSGYSLGLGSSGGGVLCGFEAYRRRNEDWPHLLGSVISTLPDSTIDDEFPNAQCEESGEVFIVAAAPTLADTVRRAASRFVEVKDDLLAFANQFVADLAGGVAK